MMDGRNYLMEDSTLTNIFTEYIDLDDLETLLRAAITTLDVKAKIAAGFNVDLKIRAALEGNIIKAERLLNDIEDTRRRLDMGGDDDI